MSLIERIYQLSDLKGDSIYKISKEIDVSNGYFANLFGVKPKAISVTIKELKDLDLINVKLNILEIKI